MEVIDKNRQNMKLLPFAVIQKAVEGDIVSINKVLKHYESYISCWLSEKCMMNMAMSTIV